MLVETLFQCLDKFNPKTDLDHNTEAMNWVAAILARLLGEELEENFEDWESSRWLDDSFLSRVLVDNKRFFIWGVMIWGRMNTTAQWTAPFYFEIELNEVDKKGFIEMIFLFNEENPSEVTFEEFDQNHGLWDREFYSNNDWEPSERNWKYSIKIKKD